MSCNTTTIGEPCRMVNIPGVPGANGAPGTAGADGAAAFTTTTASFFMPFIGFPGVIEVGDTSWMVPQEGSVTGQPLMIQFAGTVFVAAIVDATHISIYNPGYLENAPEMTEIPAGARVSPSGYKGNAGDSPVDALLKANNLSDVTDVAASRSNLGLGSAAVLAATAVLQAANNLSDVTTPATARSNLGLVPGTDVQAFNALLAGLVAAGAGAADDVPYLTAANTFAYFTATAAMRTLLASATNAALLATLKVLPRYGVIGSVVGADMNSILDQPIAMSSNRYLVGGVTAANPSINLTTAAGGIYNAVGKPGGGIIVDAAQVYTALTGSTKFVDLTLAGVSLTDIQTSLFLYLSLTTPQGAPATADIYVWGQDLS